MRFIFLGWMLLPIVFLPACTQKSVKHKDIPAGRLVKKDDSSQKIDEAKNLYDLGEIDAAISTLRLFVDTHPYHPSQDQAYVLIIEWLLQLKRHNEAKRLASHFLSNHPQSPSAQKIIDLFDKPVVPKDETHEQPNPNQEEGVQEPPVEGENEQILDLEKSVFEPKEDRRESLNKLINYVLYDAPLKQVDNVTHQRKGGLSFGLCQTRLAMHEFHLGDFKKSLEHVDRAQPHAPKEVEAILRTLQDEIKEITAVDQKTLGVLLPLSGPLAPFGIKALEAMSIALEIPLDPNGNELSIFQKDRIRVIVADSKGDAALAKHLVNLLVKKHRVAMIIGEISNEPSLLVAGECQQLGVPLLSLSRHPQIFGFGDMIFAFNSSPNQQIESLVTHAIDQSGHKRFAILFPRHNYGISMSRLFFDAVINHGGEITALEAYDAHETSFTNPIKKLVGTYYLSGREDFVNCEKQNRTACRKEIKPIIDFDALFIPEFQKLALIIPGLRQEDILVSNDAHAIKAYSRALKIENPQVVQLLGPNSWNDPGVIKKIAGHVDGAYFIDSVSFTESDAQKGFFNIFHERTSSAPTGLEVFAHDAVKLAVAILDKTAADAKRTTIRDHIAHFNGQIGLLPAFSFTNNQELSTRDVGFAIQDGVVRTIN